MLLALKNDKQYQSKVWIHLLNQCLFFYFRSVRWIHDETHVELCRKHESVKPEYIIFGFTFFEKAACPLMTALLIYNIIHMYNVYTHIYVLSDSFISR